MNMTSFIVVAYDIFVYSYYEFESRLDDAISLIYDDLFEESYIFRRYELDKSSFRLFYRNSRDYSIEFKLRL